MVNEIEILSDGEGAFVAGDRSVVERFLGHVGLSSEVEELSLSRLAPMLKSTGEVAQKAAEISEKSGYYLKLTPEAYKRLKEAGGLMPTKTKGVSHAMLGQTGKKSLKVASGRGRSRSASHEPRRVVRDRRPHEPVGTASRSRGTQGTPPANRREAR